MSIPQIQPSSTARSQTFGAAPGTVAKPNLTAPGARATSSSQPVDAILFSGNDQPSRERTTGKVRRPKLSLKQHAYLAYLKLQHKGQDILFALFGPRSADKINRRLDALDTEIKKLDPEIEQLDFDQVFDQLLKTVGNDPEKANQDRNEFIGKIEKRTSNIKKYFSLDRKRDQLEGRLALLEETGSQQAKASLRQELKQELHHEDATRDAILVTLQTTGSIIKKNKASTKKEWDAAIEAQVKPLNEWCEALALDEY